MKKATREKWLERVRAWRASGMTEQEFSTGKGFEASSLRWAVSRLGRDEGSEATPGSMSRGRVEAGRTAPSRASRVTTSPSAPRLVPVRVRRGAERAEGSADLLVEIGAVRIRVSRGADKDHVFLDFQSKHTSLTVWNMFKGFRGYVQADAHSVYDALFKGVPPEGADEEPGQCGPPPIEVGCFSHARRKYWEAAVCKHPIGLEGLELVNAIFAAERTLADLAPAQRKARRDAVVRPLVDRCFDWAREARATLTGRGLAATALGYSTRHEAALRRFLDDGRLRMDNNASERELRTIATGRKAWLFFGSDDHATAAGNILSLVASCKLHGLDPEAYLADVIRVLPYWPRERYLELAPKYWRATRARLDPTELAQPLGLVSVPPPAPEQQTSPY